MNLRTFLACTTAFLGAQVTARAVNQVPTPSDLIEGINAGDMARWRAALAKGADLSAVDGSGNTALHLAAYLGDTEAVETLLSRGAPVNAENKEGATPLLYGVGNEAIVRSLIQHGADVNAASKSDTTPLEAAVAHKNSHRVVALLLKAGANVHVKQYGVELILTDATYSEDPQTIQLLLDHGARIQPDKPGNTCALASAAYFGDTAMVAQLLDHKADASFDSDFAGGPLNYALYSGHSDIAKLLIEAGADCHQKSEWGHHTSPMVFSGYGEAGDPTIARMLLARGADINEANENGETALSFALRSGRQTPLVSYLQQSGAKAPQVVQSPKSLRAHAMPADVAIIERAQRANDLLQRASTAFINNKFVQTDGKCISCHHQDLPAVSVAWGHERGLHFDEAALGHQVEAQLAMFRPRAEAAREMQDPFADSPVQVGYGFMALKAVGYAPDAMTEAISRYVMEGQGEDGSWHWTDLRPPLEGGRFTATAWAVNSIRLYPPAHSEDSIKACFARARKWLRTNEPRTFGDQIQQLAGLGWAGESSGKMQTYASRILAAQRPNGGWSQLPGLEPDAWATGEALVALHEAHCLSTSDEAYKKGVQFLLDTQYDDGSWWVHSRTWPFQPHFDSGFPHGNDQWISAGATAWATMALLLTQERKESAGPLPAPDDLVAAYHTSTAEKKDSNSTAVAVSKVQTVDFASQVYPVFERSCIKCHSGEKPKAGLSLASLEGIMKGGKSKEPAVIPGRGTDSPIIAFASDEVEDLEMPPLRSRSEFKSLSQPELALIKAWIDEGAVWNLPAANPKS